MSSVTLFGGREGGLILRCLKLVLRRAVYVKRSIAGGKCHTKVIDNYCNCGPFEPHHSSIRRGGRTPVAMPKPMDVRVVRMHNVLERSKYVGELESGC
jgi:hypothetical protein